MALGIIMRELIAVCAESSCRQPQGLCDISRKNSDKSDVECRAARERK